jgi:hypothetical protein
LAGRGRGLGGPERPSQPFVGAQNEYSLLNRAAEAE